MGIQQQAQRLAAEVHDRDGIDLRAETLNPGGRAQQPRDGMQVVAMAYEKWFIQRCGGREERGPFSTVVDAPR